MDHFFLVTLFLYIVSALLAIGSNRAESKHFMPISKAAYLLAVGLNGLMWLNTRVGWAMHVPSPYFDGMLFALLVIGIVYFIAQTKITMPHAPAILSLMSLILGCLALLRLGTDVGTEAATVFSMILEGHIYCMFTALAAYSLSFVFSSLFLIEEYLIRKKKLGQAFLTLPSLEISYRLNYGCITIGTSALLFGLLGGIFHMGEEATWGVFWTEPTLLLSCVMLVIYLGLILWKRGLLERARTIAYTSIIGYVLLLFVYLGAHA